MKLKWLVRLFLSYFMFVGVSNAYAEKLHIPSSATFRGKSVTLTGKFAKPSDANTLPIVILLHGCSGLVGTVQSALQSHAAALRSNGFATLILDSFGPRGMAGRSVCRSNSILNNARNLRVQDVNDTISFLRETATVDSRNIFVMGQSNGGSVVSILATRPPKGLRAAAAFYPWCGSVPANPKIPLLVLSGQDDDWTPPSRCIAKDRPGGKLSVVIYPNTVHSFDLSIRTQTYQGHKVGGNRKARSDARRRMIGWFKKNLR